MTSIEIPLKQLTEWPENVRTAGGEDSLDELAASIASVGLLNNLVVRRDKKKYVVLAGKRRLAALQRLHKEKTLPFGWSAWNVPCQERDADEDGTEISLAENVAREPLHPADEFEAFLKLSKAGKPVADVAARFGVSETVVNKRLALARVSPYLVGLYRDGKMNLEQLQAFTVADDHSRQEEVWEKLPAFNRGGNYIRRMLAADNEITARDKRVRYVGLAAYEAAGGSLTRDLFSEDDEQGVYLTDETLLDRLVAEKLAADATRYQQEHGWKWVEARPELDHKEVNKFKHVYSDESALPAELEAEKEQLEAELEELQDENGENTEQETDRYREIERRLEEIEDSVQEVYPPEIVAAGGVFLALDHNGTLRATPGLLDKEAARAIDNATAENSPGTAAEDEAAEEEKGPYSAALVEELTSHKTAAVAAALSQDPDAALRLLVRTLAVNEFRGEDGFDYREQSCLRIGRTEPKLNSGTPMAGLVLLNKQREGWQDCFKDGMGIDNWIAQATAQMLLDALAYLVSRCVDGVVAKYEGKERAASLDKLAGQIQPPFRPRDWFTPTATNYFSRVSKPQILADLKDAGIDTKEFDKLKKGELAEKAEKAVAGVFGWVPAPLRVSGV